MLATKLAACIVARIVYGPDYIAQGYVSADWRAAKLVLKSRIGADGKEVVVNALNVGTFLGNIVDFVVIAFVIYLITKALIKEAPTAPSKKCPRCTETIAVEATKCKYCTTDIGD